MKFRLIRFFSCQSQSCVMSLQFLIPFFFFTFSKIFLISDYVKFLKEKGTFLFLNVVTGPFVNFINHFAEYIQKPGKPFNLIINNS